MKHNYRYVQFVMSSGNIGYATFSIKHEKKIDKDGMPIFEYVLGVAFCSPHDTFVKEIGRAKSDKMMTGSRKDFLHGIVPCTNEKSANLKAKDFIKILEHTITDRTVDFSCPNWASKAWTRKSAIVLGLHKNSQSVWSEQFQTAKV